MGIGDVDSSFQQNHSQYQSNLDLVRSTYDELSRINEEAKAYTEGSKEFNDCETRSKAVLQKFEDRLRVIVGLDKLDAHVGKLGDMIKKLDFLDRKPWDDPAMVKKSDMLARQTAPKFDWIKNVSDFSQITWKNVKVFESLDGFQSNLQCSKNEKLIKTTVDLFEKFKKKLDVYKPTLCQKIWQVITLRFTFLKVDQIRQSLEDLDVSYITEAITK